MRGLERVFEVALQTVAAWIRKIVPDLPDLKDTLAPVDPDDVLELDEAWSFVFKKSKNVGFGLPFPVAHARSWLLSLATAQ